MYRENWDNVQVAFFDPGVVGNIFFNTNGQNFLIKGVETSLVARVTTGLTLQGAASWNQSRADEFAGPAQQQSGQPRLRQADHERLQRLRQQLRAGHQPLRPDRLPERQCAADPVQPARPLRVERRRLHAVRAVRRHPQRPFLHAGRFESLRSRRPAASAPADCGSRIPLTRPTTPPSGSRRMPGT